jgi:D-xylose 1-dehydrogenase (NADP+, D-xylono-1,5-lactone-forming)
VKTVKWGVLGTATIAMEHVIPAISAARNAEIIAIASRDLKRAKGAAERLCIPRAYGSYEEILDDDNVDCMYVPVPNSMHCEWTLSALKAGRAVLCEKPMATSLAQMQEMVSTSQGTGALLGEAFMYRYHPQFKRLLDFVHKGTLGAVKIIRGSINFEIHEGPDIRLNPALGGGVLLDVGCYPLDAMCIVLNEAPIAAQATSLQRNGVDYLCAAILEFPNQRLGLMDCNFDTPWLQAPLEVVGEHAIFRLQNAYNPGRGDCKGSLITEDGGNVETFVVKGADMYKTMIESFSDSYQNGQPLQYCTETSLATAVALDMVQRSIKPMTSPVSRRQLAV